MYYSCFCNVLNPKKNYLCGEFEPTIFFVMNYIIVIQIKRLLRTTFQNNRIKTFFKFYYHTNYSKSYD